MIEGIRKVITGRGYARLLVLNKIPFYTSSHLTIYTPDYIKEIGLEFNVISSMLIQSTSSGHTTFAKAIRQEGDKIYIDNWTNGIPSDGTKFYITGWCIDLDYAQKIVQIFEPYFIKHEILRGKNLVRQYGFKYKCEIYFDKFFPSDILISFVNASYFDREKGTDIDYVLIPHKDKSGFNYRVYLSEPITLDPAYETGYAGVKLVFEGKELVNLPAIDGYGTFYGYKYGIGL